MTPANPAVKSDVDKSGPAARRLVEENKLDAAQIAATGKDGRVTKADVIQHMTKPAANAPVAPSAPAKPAANPSRSSWRPPERAASNAFR